MTFMLMFLAFMAVYTLGFYLGRKSVQIASGGCVVLNPENPHNMTKIN